MTEGAEINETDTSEDIQQSLMKYFGERLAKILVKTLLKHRDQDIQISALITQLEDQRRKHFSSLKDTNVLCGEVLHVVDVLNRNTDQDLNAILLMLRQEL